MKKILLFFAAAVCAIASWAQTDATVSATVTGEELTVALTENGQQFVAFQMDIQLPAGVTVESTGAITLMTDRLTQPGTASAIDASENVNFKVLYNVLPDNKLRVIAYNLENREIGGTAGDPLFKVALHGTSEDAITFNNIKFVTKSVLEEVDLAEVTAEAGEVDLETLYDLNDDGWADIDDAMMILEAWVNGEEDEHPEWDFNNDGFVDIDDAMLILEYWVNN